MSHRAQVLLKAIVELGISDRLKVACVNPARGRGVAAFAHAGVVTQSTLVQVWVCQGVFCRDPLWLAAEHTGFQLGWQQSGMIFILFSEYKKFEEFFSLDDKRHNKSE